LRATPDQRHASDQSTQRVPPRVVSGGPWSSRAPAANTRSDALPACRADHIRSGRLRTRNVLADYTTAVGREPPKRIVGVWFIGASVFGRQRAAASFAKS
jgi:hypothetical protein